MGCSRKYLLFNIILNLCGSFRTQDVVIEIIKSEGYIAELHSVTTDDKYILNVHRIRSPKPISKIALIMHGFQISSFAFVFPRRKYSLAFQFADNGYDVWLGNARGTEFSKKHQTLEANPDKFWDFSFHEIAIYDLPAIIDLILTKTNTTALHYIGNSQGATVVIALLASKPEYNQKIMTLHLMTPVVFIKIKPLWFSLASIVDMVEATFDAMDISREVFTVDDDTRKTLANMCNLKSRITLEICKKYAFSIAGDSPEQWNDELFINPTQLFEHLTNSVSLRQIIHFIQLYRDMRGRFLQFNYSRTKNLLLYNQSEPPEYNLKNIRAKIHVLYGTNDKIISSENVKEVIEYFKPMIIGVDEMIGWNHADFVTAKDIHVITEKITKLMNRYNYP